MAKKIAHAPGLQDNFEFDIVTNFKGYNSAVDKTNLNPDILILGSKNCYKKQSGTIAIRPGLLKYGAADGTRAGVKSSFEWYTSLGKTLPMRYANGKVEVLSDIVTAGTPVWYTLSSGLSATRCVFDAWWDDAAKKDVLLWTQDDQSIQHWSGAMGKIASSTSNSITIDRNLASNGFSSLGTLLINGNPYTYTASGTDTVYTQTPTDANFALTATNWIAQKFTTGATASGIQSATVKIKSSTSQTASALFTAALYTDNGGVPGTLVSSLATAQGSIPGAFSNGDFTVTFTFNLTSGISPSTNYHLVIYTTSSNSSTLSAYYGVTGSVGTNNSTNSGSTWNSQNGYLNATIVESTNTFSGVSPDPTGEAVGSVVIEKPGSDQNTPDANLVNNFLKVINNQVYVGSYTSRLVYISKDTAYNSFSQSNPRLTGEGDVLTLDANVNGIGVHNGNPFISAGADFWYEVTFTQITVNSVLSEQVNVARVDGAGGQAALAHEFITAHNNDIIFLDQNHQLRYFGNLRNLFEPKFPLLSLDVYDELYNTDFTGGALRIVDRICYITAPLSGADYMYEVREQIDPMGNLISERFWHPPQVRNVSRFAVINGVVYGHSNANPMIYQVWDTLQWHDDGPDGTPVPYDANARFAYRSHGRRQGKIRFDKTYFEGYITGGTNLYENIYFDYQGATNLQNVTLNSNASLAKTFTALSPYSLGEAALGNNMLGDSLVIDSTVVTDQELLPKTRIIKKINPIDSFEYALDVYSQDVDSRWEILAIGTNAVLSVNKAVEIVR